LEERGSFTVKEYRIYRMVIDAPSSTSDEDIFRDAAHRYGGSAASAEATARKVMTIFSKNGKWYGTAVSEIRQASDWNGEAP
jgi:hypothetical protein